MFGWAPTLVLISEEILESSRKAKIFFLSLFFPSETVGDRTVHPRLSFIACGFSHLSKHLNGVCAGEGCAWEQRSLAYRMTGRRWQRGREFEGIVQVTTNSSGSDSLQVQPRSPRAGCHSPGPPSPQEEILGPELTVDSWCKATEKGSDQSSTNKLSRSRECWVS